MFGLIRKEASMKPKRLISQNEFRRWLDVGKTKYRELSKSPDFPRTVAIPGGKLQHIVQDEAEAYIEKLISSRDEGRAAQ
jgi:hypothetical protein